MVYDSPAVCSYSALNHSSRRPKGLAETTWVGGAPGTWATTRPAVVSVKAAVRRAERSVRALVMGEEWGEADLGASGPRGSGGGRTSDREDPHPAIPVRDPDR